MIGRNLRRAALPRATHGHGKERPAIGCLVTKCAAGKIAPEIEMLELEFCPLLAITGQQREKDVGASSQSFQKTSHSRQNIADMSGFRKRLDQALAIAGAKTCGKLRADFEAGSRGRVLQDALVGAARHRNAIEGARDAG